MALTKTQRAVIEECVRKLEKGPSDGWDEPGAFGQPVTARDVKLWAQTWIEGPLRQVLDNDAGRVSASELRYSV